MELEYSLYMLSGTIRRINMFMINIPRDAFRKHHVQTLGARRAWTLYIYIFIAGHMTSDQSDAQKSAL